MSLQRALYVRAVPPDWAGPALAAFCADRAAHYRSDAIGGLLLLFEDRAVHVLEGSDTALRRHLSRILLDDPARAIDLRYCELAEQRLFDGWSVCRLQPQASADGEAALRCFELVCGVQDPVMFEMSLRCLHLLQSQSLRLWPPQPGALKTARTEPAAPAAQVAASRHATQATASIA
ncbi:MAG: BLUF domain-containing protein [Burkholderiaceae bacterium]|jgi:hypothetical protein|nr:BLUF domain-containing protein [Burkholderiaceae bacterium]